MMNEMTAASREERVLQTMRALEHAWAAGVTQQRSEPCTRELRTTSHSTGLS